MFACNTPYMGCDLSMEEAVGYIHAELNAIQDMTRECNAASQVCICMCELVLCM